MFLPSATWHHGELFVPIGICAWPSLGMCGCLTDCHCSQVNWYCPGRKWHLGLITDWTETNLKTIRPSDVVEQPPPFSFSSQCSSPSVSRVSAGFSVVLRCLLCLTHNVPAHSMCLQVPAAATQEKIKKVPGKAKPTCPAGKGAVTKGSRVRRAARVRHGVGSTYTVYNTEILVRY